MKLSALQGSPRKNGNTSFLQEICKYTQMYIIDVYGVCSIKYLRKRRHLGSKKIYEMGCKITL